MFLLLLLLLFRSRLQPEKYRRLLCSVGTMNHVTTSSSLGSIDREPSPQPAVSGEDSDEEEEGWVDSVMGEEGSSVMSEEGSSVRNRLRSRGARESGRGLGEK